MVRRLFALFTLVVCTLSAAACASDESMASAALRSYVDESSSGSIDKAYAILSRDVQRYCSRENFEATVEFNRSSVLRQKEQAKLIDIRRADIPLPGIVLVATFLIE